VNTERIEVKNDSYLKPDINDNHPVEKQETKKHKLNRPSWLPEKFSNAKELTISYAKLEKFDEFERKIALVSEYPPVHSGFATYAHFLVDAFRPLNLEIHLLPVTRTRVDYEAILDSLDEIKELDLIHLNHGYDCFEISNEFITFLEELRYRAKVVTTMHTVNHFRKGTDIQWFNKEIANKTDILIVHSSIMKEELLRQGILPEKILIIPHGTKVLPFISGEESGSKATRAACGIPQNMKMVLAFGFLEPDKGFEELMMVVPQMREVFLVIAGEKASKDDGQFVDRLQAIGDSQLEGRFKLINHYLAEAELQQLMAASDVIVMPYRPSDPNDIHYSVSGVLHLALGQRKPIVACSNPKFIELENLIPELVVPSMNSSALSSVLERVMTDASFRESAVAKISKYADETSWEKVARLHVKAYKKALQTTLPGYHDIEGIRLRNTSRRL
jgi:glycosyltransferase involved in cell wall biosynthesis